MCATLRLGIATFALAILAVILLRSETLALFVPAGAWGIALALQLTSPRPSAKCDCGGACGPATGLLAAVLIFAAIVAQGFLDLFATGLGDCAVVVGFALLGRDVSRASKFPSARARYRHRHA
jgi:hypothetical protein